MLIVCGQYDASIRTNHKFRAEARAETRLILSIEESLINIPRKLGLALERKEVGEYDVTAEAILKAVQDEPDRERQKKIIEAAELLAEVLE